LAQMFHLTDFLKAIHEGEVAKVRQCTSNSVCVQGKAFMFDSLLSVWSKVRWMVVAGCIGYMFGHNQVSLRSDVTEASCSAQGNVGR
jgi:hypothetical protein